jgi:DNA primase
VNIFEQVKEIPIEDVIKKYLPSIEFKTSGRWQMARCPFHEDSDPSFGINENTNSWHCFGCGKGGSTIDLVMDALGIEALEAAKELARAWNIPFQEFTPEEKTRQRELENRQQLLEKYIAWTQSSIRR